MNRLLAVSFSFLRMSYTRRNCHTLLGPLGGREGAWAGANLGVLVALLIGMIGHLVLGRGRVAQ